MTCVALSGSPAFVASHAKPAREARRFTTDLCVGLSVRAQLPAALKRAALSRAAQPGRPHQPSSAAPERAEAVRATPC